MDKGIQNQQRPNFRGEVPDEIGSERPRSPSRFPSASLNNKKDLWEKCKEARTWIDLKTVEFENTPGDTVQTETIGSTIYDHISDFINFHVPFPVLILAGMFFGMLLFYLLPGSEDIVEDIIEESM